MIFPKRQFAGMNQHYRKYPFTFFLDCMRACGFEKIELWCGAPHFMLDSVRYSDCKAIKKEIHDHGIEVASIVAPSMQWQYQLASPNKIQREKSVKYFSNGVRVAAELGCQIMAINTGWGYRGYADDAWKWSQDCIVEVANLAETFGITLALESLQPVESNLFIGLKDREHLHKILNHPAVKIMIDTVAVRVAGETIEQWFQEFGNDIVHCHFVDGRPAGHLVWGDGDSSLEETLAIFFKYNYKGIFTCELGSLYLNDPASADRRNMKVFSRYIEV